MEAKRVEYLIRITLLTLSLFLGAQDSTLQQIRNRFEFDITGKGYWQSSDNKEEKEILLPEYIQQKRTNYNYVFNRNWQYAKDNPLYHAAYNLGAHIKIKLGKGFKIYGSIFAEHRGFSYGTNSTNNILFFPQLKIAIDRKFKLGSKDLLVYGYMGNHTNTRLYEGLTIYNMYQQGHNYRFRYGKFQLHYYQINDLINGTGMYIDETFDVIASAEELELGETWRSDIRLGTSLYTLDEFYNRQIRNVSVGIYIPNKIRFYGQLSYRPTASDFKESEKIAAVTGIKFDKKTKRVRLDSRLEYRYYGGYFNAGFINYEVYYRSGGPIYGNTVGDHFYPVMLYDRPFSQWAVFAEYQDKNFYNVSGMTMTTNLKIKLQDEITLSQFYDINYIQASNGSQFLYPFYNIAIGWEPIEDNFVSVGITNKGMNLDMHYQSHYLYRMPTFMMSLSRDLKGDWFGREE